MTTCAKRTNCTNPMKIMRAIIRPKLSVKTPRYKRSKTAVVVGSSNELSRPLLISTMTTTAGPRMITAQPISKLTPVSPSLSRSISLLSLRYSYRQCRTLQSCLSSITMYLAYLVCPWFQLQLLDAASKTLAFRRCRIVLFCCSQTMPP